MGVESFLLCISVWISFVLGEYLSIPEGSSCNFNEVNGTCVSIYKCLSADFDINRKMNPPICAYEDKDPIICCTDCNLVNDTRNVKFNPNLGMLHLNGQKAHDECVKYIDQLPYRCKANTTSVRSSILSEDKSCYNHGSSPMSGGGEEFAKSSEYSHIANVGFGENWQTAKWICAGKVISHNFVLTGAHCVKHPELGVATYIRVGFVRPSANRENWQRYRVSRFIVHPDFNASSLYNNIALLETGTPIIFSHRVMPACITPPTTSSETALGDGDDKAIIHSWGTSEQRKTLNALLTIQLEKFSEEECLKEYPPAKFLEKGYDHATQMCYGRRDEVLDSCENDIGGPMQHMPFCRSTVLGVTIYGRGCSKSTRAGLYTRVSFYLPWIVSHVWP